MKLNAIQDLIKIADLLDKSGFVDDAREVDEIIRVAGTRISTLKDFQTILKDTFNEAIRNENYPTISEKSVQEIFHIVDAIIEEVDLMPPDSNSSGTRSSETLQTLSDPVIQTGEAVLNLTDDIKKLEQQMQSADEEEKKYLKLDYDNDVKSLEKLQQTVFGWKNGKRAEDQEQWQKLQEFFKQRGR